MRQETKAVPEGVRYLRREVAKTLADWGIADPADIVLACSELATNALRHGRTEVLSLELTADETTVYIAVPDENPYPPYPAAADNEDEDGRGIQLVAEVADAWGFRATHTGKSVFAEFRISPALGQEVRPP